LKVIQTSIPDLLIIDPKVFGDDRGFFFESYNRQQFANQTGCDIEFVQDNHSRSVKGVLRGLHYQIQRPQGKLVRVVQGSVLDVAVDIRKSSPTFGKHVSLELSAENKRMIWIPEGFAHGFVAISEAAEVLYKTTDYRFPEHERCIRWDTPSLAIDWQLQTIPVVSDRDAQGKSLEQSELFE
jgi:dTDP-4-dehydrorhamnose 3,5-epimerase